MTPVLFALFTAGCVAFCQALASSAEATARRQRTAAILKRLREADRLGSDQRPWGDWGKR